MNNDLNAFFAQFRNKHGKWTHGHVNLFAGLEEPCESLTVIDDKDEGVMVQLPISRTLAHGIVALTNPTDELEQFIPELQEFINGEGAQWEEGSLEFPENQDVRCFQVQVTTIKGIADSLECEIQLDHEKDVDEDTHTILNTLKREYFTSVLSHVEEGNTQGAVA